MAGSGDARLLCNRNLIMRVPIRGGSFREVSGVDPSRFDESMLTTVYIRQPDKMGGKRNLHPVDVSCLVDMELDVAAIVEKRHEILGDARSALMSEALYGSCGRVLAEEILDPLLEQHDLMIQALGRRQADQALEHAEAAAWGLAGSLQSSAAEMHRRECLASGMTTAFEQADDVREQDMQVYENWALAALDLIQADSDIRDLRSQLQQTLESAMAAAKAFKDLLSLDHNAGLQDAVSFLEPCGNGHDFSMMAFEFVRRSSGAPSLVEVSDAAEVAQDCIERCRQVERQASGLWSTLRERVCPEVEQDGPNRASMYDALSRARREFQVFRDRLAKGGRLPCEVVVDPHTGQTLLSREDYDRACQIARDPRLRRDPVRAELEGLAQSILEHVGPEPTLPARARRLIDQSEQLIEQVREVTREAGPPAGQEPEAAQAADRTCECGKPVRRESAARDTVPESRPVEPAPTELEVEPEQDFCPASLSGRERQAFEMVLCVFASLYSNTHQFSGSTVNAALYVLWYAGKIEREEIERLKGPCRAAVTEADVEQVADNRRLARAWESTPKTWIRFTCGARRNHLKVSRVGRERVLASGLLEAHGLTQSMLEQAQTSNQSAYKTGRYRRPRT